MIGENIRELRKNANMNQEQLAEKLNITRQTVSNWESGISIPDYYQSKRLADIFHTSIDALDGNININYQFNEEEIWEDTKKELKSKLISIEYSVWIEKLEFHSLSNSTLTLKSNLVIKQFLSQKYYELILSTFNKRLKNIIITNIEIIEI